MAGAASVNFNVTNLTQTVSTPQQGISFIQGRSIRGPFYNPDEIINASWPRFVEKYGGIRGDLEAPTIIKRLLEKGGSVRFSRVGDDYETALASEPFTMLNDEADLEELFELLAKYPGEDYNNITATVVDSTNGAENYFNLVITHALEPQLNEVYENLIIEGKPTAENSTYLRDVIRDSKLVEVIYKDLTGIVEDDIRPTNLEVTFSGGSDGLDVTATAFSGDSEQRTGFFAFDPYEDSYHIASLDISQLVDPSLVNIAGVAYADNRKDLINFAFLDNTTKTSLITEREKLGDNKYQYIFGGKGKVINSINGGVMEVNPIGDIFALIAASDRNFGEWYSFAGPNRGLITDMLGVEPNFGSNATWRDLDELANRQINMVIMRNGTPTLWGNFTGQIKDDQEKFINILRLIIFLKRSLRPTLEYFLEEPNDIPTWRRIFYTVKPFLDSLVTNRAVYRYEWQGDQNATNINNLQINNPTDVGKGKYKANLVIQAIPSIQEININIILAPTGVEFELINELI